MFRPNTLLKILAVLAIAVVVATVHLASVERGDPERWHRVRTGSLARIDAEHALYELEGHDHFLVRLRVSNRVDAPIGVDVSDYWAFIRPNQVGGLDQPQRQVIDESRQMPDAEALRSDGGETLRQAFADGRLVEIPVGGVRDFYVDFNGGTRETIDLGSSPYVFVSLDGELRIGSRSVVEQITLELGDGVRAEDHDLDSDLILETPVRWRAVPAGAVTVLSP